MIRNTVIYDWCNAALQGIMVHHTYNGNTFIRLHIVHPANRNTAKFFLVVISWMNSCTVRKFAIFIVSWGWFINDIKSALTPPEGVYIGWPSTIPKSSIPHFSLCITSFPCRLSYLVAELVSGPVPMCPRSPFLTSPLVNQHQLPPSLPSQLAEWTSFFGLVASRRRKRHLYT